jgi:hypothetical protein
MLFEGDPVRVIGFVEPEKIKQLYDIIVKKFNTHWIKRSFKLMDSSYCLKAITPSNFDALDKELALELKEILLPWVNPYVGAHEKVVYLDVSSLPPGAQSLPHIDYSYIHVLAKRIRIPLVTNPKSTFSLVTSNGIKTFNLEVGKVYETNNMVAHVAGNLGDSDRWHIVADIIDMSAYEYLERTGKLSNKAIDPSINFILNKQISNQLVESLKNVPINI